MVHRILVTGGSGFVGTHVCRQLRTRHEIRIMDTRPSSTCAQGFIKGDVSKRELLIKATRGCDLVIHLAAVVGVAKSESDALLTLDVNTLGTRNVLEACRLNDVRKVIFSSSSEVYGEPSKIPISEADPPMPITTYAASKLLAEEYVRAFSKAYGLRFAIARFFNLYGPGQDEAFVIPRFIRAAVAGLPLTVDGNGTQIRSFCYITDAVRGIELMMERASNELFNIGNDKEPISIKELAKRIVMLSNSKSKIMFRSFRNSGRGREREIFRRRPSIERARTLLGYEPQVSLSEGISAMIREANKRS